MKRAPIVYAMVRGARHRGLASLMLYADLERGRGVMLNREPGNAYDGNAIRVLEPEYEAQIGYVAREKAAILAPWMDAGWVYLSHIVKEARKKRDRQGNLAVFDNTMQIKCTPLDPLTTKKTIKAKAPSTMEKV